MNNRERLIESMVTFEDGIVCVEAHAWRLDPPMTTVAFPGTEETARLVKAVLYHTITNVVDHVQDHCEVIPPRKGQVRNDHCADPPRDPDELLGMLSSLTPHAGEKTTARSVPMPAARLLANEEIVRPATRPR